MNISFSGSNDNAKVLCDTKFLQLKSTLAPNGKHDWVYAHRPNAKNVVVIAPVIHNNEDGDTIVFIETNRVPVSAEGKAKTCIELPAGLVGDIEQNESTKSAIKKELLEETGYKADKIKIAAKTVASSPGCVSETSTIAIADINEDIITKEPVTDGGVILGVHKVPLDKIDKWIATQQREGKAISAQALAGLYYVMSRQMKELSKSDIS